MLTAFLSAVPYWPDAPDWLTTRVLICGLAAVGLFVLSLLLKGLQKVITLLIAVAIVLGGYWLAQDTWMTREDSLPPYLAQELETLATSALENPDAKAAWSALQKDWEHWTGEAKARLASGGEAAREAIAKRIDTKITELRKQGKKAAAEELSRLRHQVTPHERFR